MSRYQNFIGEIKYHVGWFLVASVIFAPVAEQWDIFAKILPSAFIDYLKFVIAYKEYVMSIGIVIIIWKWIKDWKMLMIIGSILFLAIRYFLMGGGV